MKRIIEIQSAGFDEYLQGVGGDPQRGGSYVGLRVPALASTPDNRVLFLGAAFSISDGAKARIIGARQLVTIGEVLNPGTDTARPVEQEVTSAVWRFTDGNVSHHLRQIGPPNGQGQPAVVQGPLDAPSFKYRWAMAPALLYQAASVAAGEPYTNLTAYTPPNGGAPFGRPIENGFEQGALYGLSFNRRTSQAWESLSIDIEGPDTVAWFIPVKQTNTSTRVALTPPEGGFVSGGLPPEEAFLQNFPNAIYWRVGVSLIVELDASSDEAIQVKA